jgi:aspartate kinase
VPRARKLDMVTYEEMLELASVGAKVLQTRSVGLAMRYNMPLQVLSSFEDLPGTMIVGDDEIEDNLMERNVITGIAHDKNEAMVTLTGLPDRPGTVAAIFAPLADANINVDMIVQSVPRKGEPSTLTFTVPNASLAHAVAALDEAKEAIGFAELITDTDVVKVSAVGVGMRSNAGIAAKMFETLGDRGINILAITTSEIKVSVLLPEDYTELAVRVLHTAFGLDAEDAA